MRRMYSLKQLQEIADSEVKKLVESGTLNNAKPLYYHTIGMYIQTGTITYCLSFIIINNSSAPIDTVAKLNTYILSIQSVVGEAVRFNVMGWYKSSSKSFAASYLYCNGAGTYQLCGGNDTTGYTDSGTPSDLATILDTPTRIVDGVNKVN